MNEFLELLLPSWGQATEDQILLIFVSIIGLVFLLSVFYFGWKTIRRQRLIKRLAEEVKKYNGSDNRPAQPSIKQQLKEKFDHKGELTEAWREFEDSLITQSYNENQIVYKTDEASLFFSDERLLDQHLNLRFWNSVPALLVGLGILGTFVGLVWGLIPFSNVDFANTDQIREAIKELLSGVSTAFVTSVWGMLASILFNGLEKWGIGRVSRAIAALQRSLDQVFTLTRAEEIAMRQQDELEQQTAVLKSVSTDFADAVKSAMEPGRQEIIQELRGFPLILSNALKTELVPRLDNLNAAVTESRNQGTLERRKIIEKLQELPTDFINAMKPSLDKLNEVVEALRDQKTELVPRLDNLNAAVTESRNQGTLERQEIIQELQRLPTTFINAMKPSLDKLNEAVGELREQKEESSADAIEQLIKQFQDSLSTSTVTQMEELARTVGNASQSLMNLPGQMEQMIAGVREQIDQTRQLLKQTSESQTERLESMIGEILNAFQSAIKTQQDGLSDTTNQVNQEMKEIAAGIQDLLKLAANRADEQLKQRIGDMEVVSNKSIQTLQTAIDKLERSITFTVSQTTTESEAMTNRMHELVDQYATRLDSIFKNGEQSVGILLQQQGKQTEAINAQLKNWQNTLTEGQEMLERMDTSVTSIRQLIETTERLSGQLMDGATQIESAGQSLTRASEAFNRENEKYLTTNRETTAQIQKVLGQSQRLLNDSVQRFQTIDNGLQGIFAEIERGLNEYAETTRDSINTYLSDFSSQLTLASAALAGSVEALNENVETLNDMIERLPRR